MSHGSAGVEAIDCGFVVTMEAAAHSVASILPPGALRRLTASLADLHAIAEGYDGRYVLQLRVDAANETEALGGAAARWRQSVLTLDLPRWPLARAEIVTGEEFGRDNAGLAPPARAARHARDVVMGDDLLRRGLHDSLTGLVNRELFLDRVRLALAEEGRATGGWAVLVCDLDDFGLLNHSAGPVFGDRLLMLLAARITGVFDEAVVCRYGGDSFALLVRYLDPGGPELAAARLLATIAMPVELDGQIVSVTASVGVASSSAMCHPADLIRQAATAMCVAKAHGGHVFRNFDPADCADISRLDADADSVPGPDRLAFALLLERAAVAANESATLEDAAAIVLQQVCAHTGWPLGHLGVTSADGAQIEPTTIWHARSLDRFERFRAMVEQSAAARGEGLAGRALQSGEMARTADMWTDEGFADPTVADLEGIAAGFAFPILVGREVVAVLEFYSAGSAAIDEALCEVMAGVGAQLGRVVERSRAGVALARTEQRFRTLADSAPSLMWVTGLDGGCTLVNSAWSKLTGLPLEALLGWGWTQLIHPDDLPRCQEIYLNAFARQEPFEMEIRHRLEGGEYHLVGVRAQPIGRGDDFQGYVGCLDIPDRQTSSPEAGRAGAMIVLMGRDGVVIAEYSGVSSDDYPPGSFTGPLGREFVHPDDVARAASNFQEVVSKPGLSPPFQCRVRHADGTWRWVEAVANNLLDYPPVQAIVISTYEVTNKKASPD